MALSPFRALSLSPNARLTDDEKKRLADIEKRIDIFLSTEWDGGIIRLGVNSDDRFNMTVKLLAAFIRRYEGASWMVGVAPLDGALAKAADLITAGAPVDWIISLQPRWLQQGLRAVN